MTTHYPIGTMLYMYMYRATTTCTMSCTEPHPATGALVLPNHPATGPPITALTVSPRYYYFYSRPGNTTFRRCRCCGACCRPCYHPCCRACCCGACCTPIRTQFRSTCTPLSSSSVAAMNGANRYANKIKLWPTHVRLSALASLHIIECPCWTCTHQGTFY